MADDITVTPGSGVTIATDDIGGGRQVQRVKTGWGPDGTLNDVDTASGKPLPVQLRGSDGTDRSSSLKTLTDIGAGEYETVAASQTAQVLGATGAAGDFISHILVIPTTVDAGNVILLDGATSITVFAGGTASLSNLVPFVIPLGLISVSGAWKVTTGAGLSAIGAGNFT
ncbi:hypothetical protein [Mesorhizobium sp. B263B2A]|uniref:hypothetical protein n=1 Tax=Mesorhizobium sp. B263B2A TaxID=2876669 RepID=UPI001CD0F9CA|nr:hypothetical protein [Mesorhizobium sp. B263B2A]MCA0032773.1 hypothetical protein [Mesorhizobium sp. B263B2A]